MAIISGRGGAPGSYIYEGAIASQQASASFNTVYMMVEAPEGSSILTFPFNRPIAISSLNEYENLIGSLPTTAGPALTSYYSVKAFFQQAPVADLRVTRVGTPSVIKEVSFNPAANKDDGFSAPSSIVKGDVFYIRLKINAIELGDRTPNGFHFAPEERHIEGRVPRDHDRDSCRRAGRQRNHPCRVNDFTNCNFRARSASDAGVMRG